MENLTDLKTKAIQALRDEGRYYDKAIDSKEFSDDVIAQKMQEIQDAEARVQRNKDASAKAEEERQRKISEENDQEYTNRLDKQYRNKALGLGQKYDPKMLDYASTIFPSLRELGLSSADISPEVSVERSPAVQDVEEIQQQKSSITTKKSKPQVQQLMQENINQESPSDIEQMIKTAREEQDRANTASQFAKLRNAIIGVGAGKPLQTDTSIYEERKNKAMRPLEDMTLKQELESKKDKNDPNSPISKLLRRSLSEMDIDMTGMDKVSYAQLEKIYPSLVNALYNKISLETKKEMAQERTLATKLLKEQEAERKKKEAAKISDKQLTPISDVDSVIANLDNVMSLAKEKFVGPADARIPDIMTSGEEAAFRSAVGRMVDAYRKAITGAGASAMELQKLESRLPDPKDTLEQFKGKALEFRRELVRNRSTYVNTLKKQGKDVSEFEQSVDQPQTLSPEERLKKYEEMINRVNDLKNRQGN